MYAEINELLSTYSYDHFPLAVQQGYDEINNHVVYQADNIERDLFKGGNSKTKSCSFLFEIYSRNLATAETMASELEDVITAARGYINNLFFVCAFQVNEFHDYDQKSRINIIRQYYTIKIRFSRYLSVDSDTITADSDTITADGGTIE